MTETAFASLFNQLEALLWFLISLGLLFALIFRLLRRQKISPSFAALCPAFFLFGLSDLIEAQTGAWWKPWWLFVLKAACVLVFLWAFLALRRKSIEKKQSPESHPWK